MESNPVLPSAPADDCDDAPHGGELIVANGRLRGARRALSTPLTLLGRAPTCEFHLNVEEVSPLHCAIVHAAAGLVLRDLGSETGTFVNGQSAQECPLRHGDVLTVGPFEFHVHAPRSETQPTLSDRQTEREALRIQAAAVAAQQASLTEEESQCRQRRKVLQRQKEQLAAHLDERRQELMALRDQAKQDRAALKNEADEARRQIAEVRDALAKERQTAQDRTKQADKERRRSIELRKRLKKRWRKHWQAHEAALASREKALQIEKENLSRQADALERERVRWVQTQLRHKGEVELGRRQLRDEWQQLGLAQQQWEECLNKEQAERARRLRDLDQRSAEQAESERSLTEQRRLAEQLQLQLRKEAEGLEARVRNQRLKLVEQERQCREIESKRPREDKTDKQPETAVARACPPDVPRVLSRLADNLADQRRHLLEQWHCLLELYHEWEPERSAILAQFERSAHELVRIEQRLTAREQAVQVGESELCNRQQTLLEVRGALEAWQARLTVRETFLDNERVMLLADVRAREEMAEERLQRFEKMRQRLARRRGQEIEERNAALAQHEEMRREYSLLWQECQERRAELIREQREVNAKALALEQLRQDLLGRADDTPEADKRTQRLQRQIRARLLAEERDLKRERAALKTEIERLDHRSHLLFDREESDASQYEAWMRQVAEWEERQTASADLEQRRRQELRYWQLLNETNQRQLTELRDEVERLAHLLLEEPQTLAPPVQQAA